MKFSGSVLVLGLLIIQFSCRKQATLDQFEKKKEKLSINKEFNRSATISSSEFMIKDMAMRHADSEILYYVKNSVQGGSDLIEYNRVSKGERILLSVKYISDIELNSSGTHLLAIVYDENYQGAIVTLDLNYELLKTLRLNPHYYGYEKAFWTSDSTISYTEINSNGVTYYRQALSGAILEKRVLLNNFFTIPFDEKSELILEESLVEKHWSFYKVRSDGSRYDTTDMTYQKSDIFKDATNSSNETLILLDYSRELYVVNWEWKTNLRQNLYSQNMIIGRIQSFKGSDLCLMAIIYNEFQNGNFSKREMIVVSKLNDLDVEIIKEF